MNGAADRFDVVQMGEGKLCHFRDLDGRACEADVLGDVICIRRDDVHLVCLRRATLERLLKQLPSEEALLARGRRRPSVVRPEPPVVPATVAVDEAAEAPLGTWGHR